jgi:hypothetical protein
MDLLNTYNSYLQVTVSQIYTLYKSLHCGTHKVFYVFAIRCLVTAPNNVDSSVSVLMSLPAGDCLATPHARNSLFIPGSHWLSITSDGNF